MHTSIQAYLDLLPPSLHVLYRQEQARHGTYKNLYHVLFIIEDLLQKNDRQQELDAKSAEFLHGLLLVSTGLKLDQELPPALSALLAWIFQGTMKIQTAMPESALPADVATQHALASTLFAWNLLLRQTLITYLMFSQQEESHEGHYTEEQFLAKDYTLLLMELCGSNLLNTYNNDLTHYQRTLSPSLDLKLQSAILSQQAVLMLTVGLASISEAYGVPLTGTLWQAVVEDPSFLENPEQQVLFGDSNRFIYALWVNLQIHITSSGIKRPDMLSIMAAHCNETTGLTQQLFHPYRMIRRISTDLQLPIGQIFA